MTVFGLRLALFVTWTPARILPPGLAILIPEIASDDSALRAAFDRLERQMDAWCTQAELVA